MPAPAASGSSSLSRSHTTTSHRSSSGSSRTHESSSRAHEPSSSSRTREHSRASSSGGRTVRASRAASILPTLEEHQSYLSPSGMGIPASFHAPDPSRLVTTPAASRMTSRRVSELRGTGPGGSSMIVGSPSPSSHSSRHSESRHSSSRR